jgi:hypothetical protein
MFNVYSLIEIIGDYRAVIISCIYWNPIFPLETEEIAPSRICRDTVCGNRPATLKTYDPLVFFLSDAYHAGYTRVIWNRQKSSGFQERNSKSVSFDHSM